jgi:type II secretion system protein G
MKQQKNSKKGFTLIELLVVVAIMGMLAALAVIALNNARARARDARRVSDIKQIQTALELYYLDNNTYPAADSDTQIDGQCLDETGFNSVPCSGSVVYMSIIPDNPKPYDDHAECTLAYSYYLYSRQTNRSYTLKYCVGADIGQIDAGLHTATPGGIVED